MTGNWRDSEQGLGRGRYAYDVNAALVPAALEAAARLAESGLLDEYLDAGQRRMLAQAGPRARVWSARAPSFFAVDVPAARARADIAHTRRRSASMVNAPCAPWTTAAGVPCAVAGRAGEADPHPAFGRRLPAAAHRTCRGRHLALPRRHHAAVSGRAGHRRGSGGGESGARNARTAQGIQPLRVPRHRGLVVAAGAAGRRPRAPAAARRSARDRSRAAAARRARSCGP